VRSPICPPWTARTASGQWITRTIVSRPYHTCSLAHYGLSQAHFRRSMDQLLHRRRELVHTRRSFFATGLTDGSTDRPSEGRATWGQIMATLSRCSPVVIRGCPGSRSSDRSCPQTSCMSSAARISTDGWSRSGSCGRGGQHEAELIAQGYVRFSGNVAGPLHRSLVVLLEQDRPDQVVWRPRWASCRPARCGADLAIGALPSGWWSKSWPDAPRETHVREDVLLDAVQEGSQPRLLRADLPRRWR